MKDSDLTGLAGAGLSVRVGLYVKLMRPYQWVKNLAVFPPVAFSLGLFDPSVAVASASCFVSFCIISGSAYALNDVLDASADRSHPTKRFRPVASGAIARPPALMFSGFLMVLGLAVSYVTDPWLLPVVGGYWALSLVYSVALKHLVLIDVMSIGAGFVLRVVGGTTVTTETPSNWLLLSTFFLALLLALGKRRQELVGRGDGLGRSRDVLEEYGERMLDQILAVVAGLVIIVYGLFSVSEYAVERFGTTALVYTVPFVFYGTLRYLYLIYRVGQGEDPSLLLLKDYPMAVCVSTWGLACMLIIYWDRISLS